MFPLVDGQGESVPSSRAVSPSATKDGAKVPRISNGVRRPESEETNERELPERATDATKHVHVTAYVSEKNFSMQGFVFAV